MGALVVCALRTLRLLLDVDTLPSCEVVLAALAAGINSDADITADKIKIINFFIATSFLVTLKAGKNQGLSKRLTFGLFWGFLLCFHSPFAYMHVYYIIKPPHCEYSKLRKNISAVSKKRFWSEFLIKLLR